MNLKKMLAGISLLSLVSINVWSTPIEILTNGDFETGDLTGWTQLTPVNSIEWGVTTGDSIGAYSLVSSDESHFASPWMEGPNPISTTLFQRFDLNSLSATLLGTFTFSAEAIFANDRITLGYELFDTNLNLLTSEVVYTALGGESPTSTNVSESFSLLTNTRYISFFATGDLVNGSYIDAGFDQASILVDVSNEATEVPAPYSLSLFILGIISLVGARRYKAS